jgi:hypothetical protein
MGCASSAPIQPGIARSRSHSLRHYVTNDVDMICFYPQIREAYLKFLTPLKLNAYMRIYEIIDVLQRTEMNGVVSIIESHRLTILSNTSIQELKLSEYSKHKLQLLHKAKEYDPVLIKEFDSVRLELQSILHLSVLDFQNSKMFSDSLQFRGRRISLSQKMVTKEKLLLAVGNPFMAKIITKMMQDLYYDVTCVSTGMSAMSELMNSVYHVTYL